MESYSTASFQNFPSLPSARSSRRVSPVSSRSLTTLPTSNSTITHAPFTLTKVYPKSNLNASHLPQLTTVDESETEPLVIENSYSLACFRSAPEPDQNTFLFSPETNVPVNPLPMLTSLLESDGQVRVHYQDTSKTKILSKPKPIRRQYLLSPPPPPLPPRNKPKKKLKSIQSKEIATIEIESNNKRIVKVSNLLASKFEIVFFDSKSLLDQNYTFFSEKLSYPKPLISSNLFSPASPSTSPTEWNYPSIETAFDHQIIYLPKPNLPDLEPKDLIAQVKYMTQGLNDKLEVSQANPILLLNTLLREALVNKIFRAIPDESFTEVIVLYFYNDKRTIN